MRAFVALPLDDGARRAIGSLIRPLAASGDGVRWVRQEDLHLTLAFLGWIDASLGPAIAERLAPVAAATAPERLVLAGAGGFPASRPKVLWLGLATGGPWYASLARAVRAALEEGLGLELDRREPAAHLTMARSERGGRALLELVESAFAERTFESPADRMVLYSSVLGRGGPTYRVEREWAFGGLGAPPVGG